MASREMMILDLDQEHWHRVFGLNGPVSLVLLELAGLEATTAAACLTPFELERFALFTFPKRKREWLGGRIAAKQAAMAVASLGEGEAASPWQGMEVAAAPDGRPFIRAVDDIGQTLPDISISHSGNLAGAMAAGEGRCGIDIQKVTPTVIKVSERFAGAAEMTILDTLTGDLSMTARLTLLWAAKEALRKAIGTKRLPGFLGIMLAGTRADNHTPVGDYFVFDFTLTAGIATQSAEDAVSVAVLLHEGYGLAFTAVPKQYIK
jgi:phosphopantetheinyl transferase